jgi:hypothetical protein
LRNKITFNATLRNSVQISNSNFHPMSAVKYAYKQNSPSLPRTVSSNRQLSYRKKNRLSLSDTICLCIVLLCKQNKLPQGHRDKYCVTGSNFLRTSCRTRAAQFHSSRYIPTTNFATNRHVVLYWPSGDDRRKTDRAYANV